MGLPLRISDDIVLRAREEAEASDRSLTGQIEHWVKLGMAVEALLGHPEVLELKRRGKALSLEQAHAFAHSPAGKERARRHLAARKGPRYAADPERPDRVVRVEADGTRTRGRLVDRVFVPDAG
jgi:hypothetical protein